jgi:hypothetical protein
MGNYFNGLTRKLLIAETILELGNCSIKKEIQTFTVNFQFLYHYWLRTGRTQSVQSLAAIPKPEIISWTGAFIYLFVRTFRMNLWHIQPQTNGLLDLNLEIKAPRAWGYGIRGPSFHSPRASSWRDETALYFYLVLICLYVTEPTAILSLSLSLSLSLIHPFPFNHGVAIVHCAISPCITLRTFHIYTELVIPFVKIGLGTGESMLWTLYIP